MFSMTESVSDTWCGCTVAVGVQVHDFAFSSSSPQSDYLSVWLLTNPLPLTANPLRFFYSGTMFSMTESVSDTWCGCTVAVGVQVHDFAFSSLHVYLPVCLCGC
jgi:hypothetical protein